MFVYMTGFRMELLICCWSQMELLISMLLVLKWNCCYTYMLLVSDGTVDKHTAGLKLRLQGLTHITMKRLKLP